MQFAQLLSKIAAARQQLTANRDADALRIAFDLSALIKLRIQTKGQSSTGQLFAPYDPVYKKERSRAGYQVGFVDYTRTGRFFASIRPTVTRSTLFTTEVTIAPQDERGRDIVEGAKRKRGNILEASEADVAFVEAANAARVQKYLKF